MTWSTDGFKINLKNKGGSEILEKQCVLNNNSRPNQNFETILDKFN